MENGTVKQKLENAKTYGDITKAMEDLLACELIRIIQVFEDFQKYSDLTMRDETILTHAKMVLKYRGGF